MTWFPAVRSLDRRAWGLGGMPGLRALCLLIGLAGRAGSAEPPPVPTLRKAEPDLAFERRFRRDVGWIGSDAIYTIPLPDASWLWVFGDTLVGEVRGGRRWNVSMVNNSFARQRGFGNDMQLELQLHRDARGQASSFVTPLGKPGYFWIWDGLVIDGRLYLFTTRLTSPGTITAFDWKLLDQSVVVVENPLDPPAQWKHRQVDFPHGHFTETSEALWGLEVVHEGEWIYVFGTRRQAASDPRELVLARVAPREFPQFDRWRFFSRGEWVEDARRGSSLAVGVGTEGSVTWLPEQQVWVYVYSPPLDANIQIRAARTLVGPWSEPQTLYACPDPQRNPRIFCYAAKARSVPGTRNELLVSYATNSFEMLPDVSADAEIYQPRFVRVTFEPARSEDICGKCRGECSVKATNRDCGDR
ncbi:MAG: DUF4185 domain-containing protein [Planctomycetaceae bacterium]